MRFDITFASSAMSLPPSHRRRNLRGYGPLLRPSGPVRSSTPGSARRPSPYPSPPVSNARPRASSHPPSDDADFENSCFNNVYISDDEKQTPSKRVHFHTPSSAKEPSAALDEDEESMDDDEEDDKIPKPNGEVGRPGRGGYNLRIALGWEDERYDKVKVSIVISNLFHIPHLIPSISSTTSSTTPLTVEVR